MKIAKYLLSLMLALGGPLASAQVINIYDTAELVPHSGGGVELLGFGRGGTSLSAPAGASVPTTPSPQSASIVREFFLDTWNVQTSQVGPGEYSFSGMTVDATGSLLFSAVTFHSYDASPVPILNSVLFTINPEGTQAVGSGTFTVRSECPVASCIWIQVIGTQTRGEITDGYGGTTIATVVPEPASWALLALGLAAIGGAVRRARAS